MKFQMEIDLQVILKINYLLKIHKNVKELELNYQKTEKKTIPRKTSLLSRISKRLLQNLDHQLAKRLSLLQNFRIINLNL